MHDLATGLFSEPGTPPAESAVRNDEMVTRGRKCHIFDVCIAGGEIGIRQTLEMRATVFNIIGGENDIVVTPVGEIGQECIDIKVWGEGVVIRIADIIPSAYLDADGR